MKDKAQLFSPGVFGKPHGIKGEIALLLDDDSFADIVAEEEFLFVDLDGLLVPYRIMESRPKGNSILLVTLKGVDDNVMAATFTGKEVYLENVHIEDDTEDGQFYLEDLIGYKAYNGEDFIGTIQAYDDSTMNLLFEIESPSGESVLIPASDELITEIDSDTQIVRMDLPSGLLDLF